MKVMNVKTLFEYNKKKKIMNGLILIGFFIFASFIISLYFLYFSKLGIFQGTFLETVLDFFKEQIGSYTLLGAFLLAMVGGLFFIPLPMEILFATYVIKNSNTPMLVVVYLTGLTIGYSINLIIGYKFSNFSRNLISTKQFYKIKCTLNKYGKLAVFLSNALPLPSQQVSFILGVFKYNKTKFYSLFLLGQTLKVLAITGFMLIFK